MGNNNEMRAVGGAPQQINKAADVSVVKRGLHLVEEIERARPGQEEGEQERNRTERLLAAREKREPRDLLAGRPQLDLDAGLRLLVALLRLVQPELTLAAREARRGDLLEV